MTHRPEGGPRSEAHAALGLVVVHGIGSQRRCATAEQVLRAVDLVGERPTGELRWSGGEHEPAHVRVGRRLDHGAGERTLLLVDAWWDDVVDLGAGLRRRWRIWWWCLRVLPMLLLFHAAAGAAAAAVKAERRGATVPPSRAAKGVRTVTGMTPADTGVLLRVVHSMLLRFLVLPVLCLVLLLAVMPLAQLADFAWRLVGRTSTSPIGRRMDGVLLATVGDAWAFVLDRDTRDSIVRRVAEVLRWTRQRCSAVVLLGHSQGGAISRAVLAGGERADQLVTVGSGANTLGALFNTARYVRFALVPWLLLLTYPALVAFLVQRFVRSVGQLAVAFYDDVRRMFSTVADTWRTGQPPDSSGFTDLRTTDYILSNVWWDVALALGGILLVVVLFRVGQVPLDPSTQRPPVQSWWDIASAYDPVCVGGHSLEEYVVGVDVVNATKLRQLLLEHVRYFGNPAVGAAVGGALAAGALGADTPPGGFTTERPSMRWHRWLSGYWWWGIPVTLGLAAGVLYGYLQVIGLLT